MVRTPKLTPRQEAERASWQYRAIEATRGNTTRAGAILLAALGKNAKHPPGFGPSCVITPDGVVLSNFVDRHGVMHVGLAVCDVEDLISNFRRLAEHCKFNDEEHEALFSTLRKWVIIDYRADEHYDEIRRNIH